MIMKDERKRGYEMGYRRDYERVNARGRAHDLAVKINNMSLTFPEFSMRMYEDE